MTNSEKLVSLISLKMNSVRTMLSLKRKKR
jgi:hypothetical protein